MPSKVSPLTLFFVLLSLVIPIIAYAYYPDSAPSASEVLRGLGVESGGVAGRLGEAVSSALYTKRDVVWGEPHRIGGMMVRVGDAIVMPSPGLWVTEHGRTLRPMEVMLLLAKAERVRAEGYEAVWYMGPHGRVKVLVAEKIEVVINGVSVDLERVEDAERWGEEWGYPMGPMGMPMHHHHGSGR
ncbi:MAG: hypothetical protein F7B17_05080 [Desulfurococcales archaeon]|nr:hypothetical protein [Desulfurococcales archaeon]